MTLALMLLSQAVTAQPTAYREAFEPYRQCVITYAKQSYTSNENLKVIFESAESECKEEAERTLVGLTMTAAMLADDKPYSLENPHYSSQDRFDIFERELIFELAQDFTPKMKQK